MPLIITVFLCTAGNYNASYMTFANCSIVNDADTSMQTMDTNKEFEFELRVKLRELQEENNFLHDELERHEASVNNARQQHSIIEKQLYVFLGADGFGYS